MGCLGGGTGRLEYASLERGFVCIRCAAAESFLEAVHFFISFVQNAARLAYKHRMPNLAGFSESSEWCDSSVCRISLKQTSQADRKAY
jgi:hypothetical protein